MTWHLLGFDRVTDAERVDVQLPDAVDDDFVRALIGDYQNLRGASFPLGEEHLAELSIRNIVEIDDRELDYFIEFVAE